MKKLITIAAFFFSVLSLTAQTKITKSSVVGKWSLTAVEMSGMFSYNIDTDSLELGETLKAQAGGQLDVVKAAMKPQLAVFSKMTFQFNTDGTAVLAGGTEAPQDATYSVDEANSTITTIDKDKKEETLKGEMILEKLRITLHQPQGDIIMTLKKSN